MFAYSALEIERWAVKVDECLLPTVCLHQLQAIEAAPALQPKEETQVDERPEN
jgi:hypothetical protein